MRSPARAKRRAKKTPSAMRERMYMAFRAPREELDSLFLHLKG
jgi:hypothetical protein